MKRSRAHAPVLIGMLRGLPFLFVLQACGSRADPALTGMRPDSAVESEVRALVNDVYDLYTSGDLRWLDYYADEYTVITDDGRSVTEHADSLRAQWARMYDQYDVVVTERGEPTVLASGDKALHYNEVGEMFIDKATGDTTRNGVGMWIAAWEHQADGTWRIVLETYQAR